MTREDFVDLMTRLADAWNDGSVSRAAACFAELVDYADPTRYRFGTRAELVPFFEPPPGGHEVTWHRILFDETRQEGAVEYTYRGDRRYHGAAFVEVDEARRITRWREYQHLDDAHDFERFLAGPG